MNDAENEIVSRATVITFLKEPTERPVTCDRM